MKQQIDKNDSKNSLNATPRNASAGLSCVGWFKLAELVERKEKEKALSLHRLLSHSFEDKAYSLQLEGDILWSLEDEQAVDKYRQAAFLYKKEKKISCALAIYEHLLTLQPQNHDFLATLLRLYAFSNWPEKFEEHYWVLLDHLDQKFISQESFLTITKRIIDLVREDKAPDHFQEIYLNDLEDNLKEWLLKSLRKVLTKYTKRPEAKNSKIKELVSDYCLEHNLRFDS